MDRYIIKTSRLGLRNWNELDITPFASMNADQEVMRYFPGILTMRETIQMIDRINRHIITYGFGLYAIEKLSTKEFIGYTGLMIPQFESFFTPCVEIGWRIKKEEWNMGFATEAAMGCLIYGFNILQLKEVYSFTSMRNRASERVMEKIGMVKAGEFDHPNIPLEHPLSRHLLYKIEKPESGLRQKI